MEAVYAPLSGRRHNPPIKTSRCAKTPEREREQAERRAHRGSAVERGICGHLVGCLGLALKEGEHLGGERARPARCAGSVLELRHHARKVEVGAEACGGRVALEQRAQREQPP